MYRDAGNRLAPNLIGSIIVAFAVTRASKWRPRRARSDAIRTLSAAPYRPGTVEQAACQDSQEPPNFRPYERVATRDGT